MQGKTNNYMIFRGFIDSNLPKLFILKNPQ